MERRIDGFQFNRDPRARILLSSKEERIVAVIIRKWINKVVLFSSIEKRLKKMGDAINALYRRIYIYNIHTAYRTASLIIGYSFHDLFPFLSFGTYEASFLFFTTHRSFVFVWTVSVDCHSLGQPLEFAAPNVISNARLQIRKEYEKEQKGKGKLRREERDKKDTIFLLPKKIYFF